MFRKRKIFAVIAVTGLLATGVFQFAAGEDDNHTNPSPDEKMPAMTNTEKRTLYNANRFTQPEVETNADLPIRAIPDAYTLAASSDQLELYVNRKNASILVKNKKSGYVWGSVPKDKVLQNAKLNDQWLAKVHSPLLIGYFNEEAMLNEGSFGTLGGRVKNFQRIDGGFAASIRFEKIDLDVTMKVTVDDRSLVVQIPDDEIREGKTFKLASLQPYPFLGSVLKAETPGYMFVPDGSGALIRFREKHPNYGVPFDRKIYGSDASIDSQVEPETGMQPMAVPVFGVVHGVGKNAFLGVVENGKYNAEIEAFPSGVHTAINWISTKFIVRNAYFQPTSKNMGGINTFQKKRISSDHQIRYFFLDGDEADYTGMAKRYRDYLIQKGALSKQSNQDSSTIPLRVEFLGAEMTPALLGVDTVTMTTFEDAGKIVEDLLDSGIQQMKVVYRGWGEGGLTGNNPKKFPVSEKLGGSEGLESFQHLLRKHRIPLYLYTDYMTAYQDTDHFSIKRDAIRKMSNEILKGSFDRKFIENPFEHLTFYFLNPGKAKAIAAKDVERLAELDVKGMAIAGISNRLFSDHHPERTYSRLEAAETYEQLAKHASDRLGSVAMYEPNDYLVPETDAIFDIPMSSSHYMYETDTVPFLQIVYHGFVDYFADFSNFHANPHEKLLRMIEYGAYPSFYLTKEPSWKLQDTPSSRLFTSQYDNWKDEILLEYRKANQALRHVQNAMIEDRSVPAWGVVKVTYSNGYSVVVNYTGEEVKVNGETIKANGFKVIGGET
ncbi:MAG TPA: DUF5696 domain-containing protein [Bacillales bacterium]|nr:DUF5696 domain-containing protein [Bacillales bacterium]